MMVYDPNVHTGLNRHTPVFINYSLVVLVLFSYFTISCSPLRRIDMKNHSGQDVKITWTLKEMDSLGKSPFFMSNSRKVRFELKPNEPYNEVKMSFGIGTWPALELKEITDRLESLEIVYAKGTIYLQSPEEIYSFLYERRKGIGKRKIEIMVGE